MYAMINHFITFSPEDNTKPAEPYTIIVTWCKLGKNLEEEYKFLAEAVNTSDVILSRTTNVQARLGRKYPMFPKIELQEVESPKDLIHAKIEGE